jgi:5,10-methylenetetrahydromethanopterin reductase
MYRVSFGITTKMSVETTGWIAANADTLGVDGVWIGEDINAGQETSVLAASVLLQTSRIRVGTGIIPIGPHSISTIARSALALHEIGNGRFVLGIGIGGIQDLERAGILIQKPVTEMRKATSILRELLSGTDVTEDTELTRLKNYRLRLQDDAPVPIFYGVRGPKMLALAGRLADGVILSGPFDYLVEAVKIVNTAAKKSGREPESIGKVVWLPTIPTFRGMKEKTARKIVTLILADTPDAVINMLNLDKEELLHIRDSVSIGGVEAGVDLITDEILEAFSISGSKDHMVDRFDRIADIGATELVIGPPYSGEWKAAIRELISEIQSRRDSE